MKNYRKFTAGLVVAWFLFAMSASAMHMFENAYNRLGIAVAVAASTPILLFSIWFATSYDFRKFLLSLSPRTLTLLHTWRVLGITFVALAAAGRLPAAFALPAGWGDFAIGVTAPLIAW